MKSMYSQAMALEPSLWPTLARSIDVASPGRTIAWPPTATLLTLISESCARAIVSRVWMRPRQYQTAGASGKIQGKVNGVSSA